MSLVKSVALLALASTALAFPQQYGKPVAFPHKLNKWANSTCTPLPAGSGPNPSPDTPEAFVDYGPFSQTAQSAGTPDGYDVTFTDLHATDYAQDSLGYQDFASYDPNACAAKCTAEAECAAFNIYFERSPSVDPADGCTNPPSTTSIRCVLFSGLLSPQIAENPDNSGQYRRDFRVVIAGSNGYIKEGSNDPGNPNNPGNPGSPDIAGYTSTSLENLAIEAPLDCTGTDTYMGYTGFPLSDSTPYNPSRCVGPCEETGTCHFFNSYILLKNGAPVMQVCSMYTNSWTGSYATNVGQYGGSDHYTITSSYSYSNSNNPYNACTPAQAKYVRRNGPVFS